MTELGYPNGIYQCIFYTALFLHPIHIYVGFSCEMNSCAFMGVALYATSLNYWRNPVMSSYRRTVDAFIAKSSIAYHIYLSFYTRNWFLTTLPFLTGTSLYFVSFYLYDKKYVKCAAFCHCLLHLLVSIGASLTYKDYYSQAAINNLNQSICHMRLQNGDGALLFGTINRKLGLLGREN
jgi:hypothetical protein